MTSIVPSQCNGCARLRPGGITCDAYPEQIPQDMLTAGGDHRTPRHADGGLQFKLDTERADAREAFEQWRRTFAPS